LSDEFSWLRTLDGVLERVRTALAIRGASRAAIQRIRPVTALPEEMQRLGRAIIAAGIEADRVQRSSQPRYIRSLNRAAARADNSDNSDT
jgi:hypothetical protein